MRAISASFGGRFSPAAVLCEFSDAIYLIDQIIG